MKIQFVTRWLLLFLVAHLCAPDAVAAETAKPVVRVAVVSGMARSGVWQALVKRFEAENNFKLEVTTGQRPDVTKALQEGRVDAAIMHVGEVATALVKDGFAQESLPFARNEYVVVGPAADPAKIKGLTDTAAALKRIAATESPFVNHEGAGSRELGEVLWTKAGLRPEGKWCLADESGDDGVAAFASQKHAYVITSRNPKVVDGLPKLNFAIMVEGDPIMKRPFLFLPASRTKFPTANHAGAQSLAKFLLSAAVQSTLADLGKADTSDRPFLYPMTDSRRK